MDAVGIQISNKSLQSTFYDHSQKGSQHPELVFYLRDLCAARSALSYLHASASAAALSLSLPFETGRTEFGARIWYLHAQRK